MAVVQVRELKAERTFHITELWHEHSLYHGAVDFFRLRSGYVLAVTAGQIGLYRSRESFHRRCGPLERGLLGIAGTWIRPIPKRPDAATGLRFVDRIVSEELTDRPSKLRVDRLYQDERELARVEPEAIWVGRIRIWSGPL